MNTNSKATPEEISHAAAILNKLSPGFLPREIFEQYTRLCVTPIVELVPLRRNGEGATEVLLFARSDDDPCWPGMLHTPGTVLLSTDVDMGIEAAIDRIISDEIQTTLTAKPVFVGSVFHKVARGTELAHVYFIDLAGIEISSGTWINALNLPENIVNTQTGFIGQSVELYNSQIERKS